MPNLEKERIRALEQQIADRDHFIRELLASSSWKITRPLRWLHAHLSRLIQNHNSPNQASNSAAISTPELLESKNALMNLARAELKAFLASGRFLQFPTIETPELSIVLVVHNRAELTLRCLASLKNNSSVSYEIVIVNNASEDQTTDLLEQIRGVRILRNEQNAHFILGANQGAKAAKGTYLLFLNNDTEVLNGAIESALDTIKTSKKVGAVGGKLILPDGSLQEAGSIVWQDGSCAAFGRGDDPFAPQYMFQREVDFCSAAFLLTSRETFLNLGGFDEVFKPAYYEDADYCWKLHQAGLHVIYDPNVAAIHYEFGSSDLTENAIQLQIQNRETFFRKHQDVLKSQTSPGNHLIARTHSKISHRILYIDDRVPHPSRGSGFPRSHAILTALLRLDFFVTLYPMSYINEDWSSVYSDVPREVEVILSQGRSFLESFLEQRDGYYETLFVSRPQNMQILDEIRNRRPELFKDVKLIYDAEALFAMREAGKRRLSGEDISEKELSRLIQQEIGISSHADVVLTVSEQEAELWRKFRKSGVEILGHAIDAHPLDTRFEEREGFLFVGTIQDDSSPNADAIRWFITEIFPEVRQKLGNQATLVVAGVNHSETLEKLGKDGITFAGYREDLTPFYSKSRVFIAPSRIAAGLPLKIQEAAAFGVPVVATSLLGRQLGWSDGEQILLADSASEFAEKCTQLYRDPDLWRRIRAKALQAISAECSPDAFQKKLAFYLGKKENT